MGQKTFMSHLPPLKDDELRELIKKAQAGDEVAKQKAKDKIVCSNLLLVYSLVQRFNGRGYDWDDLVQIGIIGLLKAIENFDLSYKCKPFLKGFELSSSFGTGGIQEKT